MWALEPREEESMRYIKSDDIFIGSEHHSDQKLLQSRGIGGELSKPQPVADGFRLLVGFLRCYEKRNFLRFAWENK